MLESFALGLAGVLVKCSDYGRLEKSVALLVTWEVNSAVGTIYQCDGRTVGL